MTRNRTKDVGYNFCTTLKNMPVRVVEFSSGGYTIRKKWTYPKKIIEFWVLD